MPTPCYISITGQTQGNITAGAFTADSVGNIYVQGHEDEMLVQEFLHNVTVPTDPQSGQPAGQRAHKPFIFTVALNKAVPLMYNALASGEMLPTTELHWWRTSVEGKQEHYFTTRLTDSTIVDMKLHMPHCQDPAKREFTQLLEVSLAYRKLNGNTSNLAPPVLTTGAHRWKHKLSQQHPAIRPDAVLYYAVERKVVSKGLRSREMAAAGNFGGSVPERKRNTVLSQPL